MNIFALDNSTILAAQYACDKHKVKMVLETAQLLSNALWINLHIDPGSVDVSKIYKPTHLKHPCSIWASRTRGNFFWLAQYGFCLAGEYEYLYGKKHKSVAVIQECAKHYDLFTPGGREDFVLCMPEQYKTNNAVESYREYYRKEKSSFAKWKDGRIPPWWNEEKISAQAA